MASKGISIDITDVKLLRAKLDELSKKAIPFGMRTALTTTAFEARKVWADKISRSMILRNKWTVGSLRVVKAAGYDIATMHSQVGSLAPYMDEQESGGTKAAKGGARSVPIPTTTAAGQAMRAPKRTREVRKANWQSAISLAARPNHGVRQYRNMVAIANAAKSGGVVFLDLGRRKGLFRVTGTKKGSLRVRMLWDMSRRAVRIPPTPTLEPTVQVMVYKAPRIFEVELQKQVDRCLARLKK